MPKKEKLSEKNTAEKMSIIMQDFIKDSISEGYSAEEIGPTIMKITCSLCVRTIVSHNNPEFAQKCLFQIIDDNVKNVLKKMP